MKINLDIDCTAAEARELMGLPDVRPLQTAMMGKLEAQMTESLEKLSPEAMLRNWFPFDPKNGTRLQDMFASFLSTAASRSGG